MDMRYSEIRSLQRTIAGCGLTRSACDIALTQKFEGSDKVLDDAKFQEVRRILSLLANKVLLPDEAGILLLGDNLKNPDNLKLLEDVLIPGDIGSEALCENLLHYSICTKNIILLSHLLRFSRNPNQQVFGGRKMSILTLAAQSGNLNLVRALIEGGADVNGVKLERAGVQSPLFAAVERGSLEVARYLLDCGAKVDCRAQPSSRALTALARATRVGDLKMVQLLLDSGAFVDSAYHTRNSPLYQLINWYGSREYNQQDRLHILELLIKARVFINAIVSDHESLNSDEDDADEDDADEDDEDEESPGPDNLWPRNALELSAVRGSPEIITALLASGARMSDRTILFASRSGSSDCVSLLLKRRSQTSKPLLYAYQVLQEVVRSGEVDVVRALLQAGAMTDQTVAGSNDCISDYESQYDSDHDSEDEISLTQDIATYESTPLELAVKGGNIQLVRLLLAAGATISTPPRDTSPGRDREILLEIAAKSGKCDVLNELLRAGANVKASEKVLVYAIKYMADLGVVLELIREGANVNASADTNSLKMTPLQTAVSMGGHATAHALLDAGADPDAPAASGCDTSALCIAIEKKDWYLTRILLERGVNVNNPPCGKPKNRTALWHAAVSGDLGLVCRLLQLGADPNDSAALAAAVKFKHLPVLNVLLRFCQYPRNDPRYGCDALQVALKHGDHQLVQTLLHAQIRTDIPVTSSSAYKTFLPWQFDSGIHCSLTALGAALSYDKTDDNALVRTILATGVDPNACADFSLGYNAIQLAAERGKPGLVQLLIQAGADVNRLQYEDSGRLRGSQPTPSPLFIAAKRGDLQMVSFLLQQGAVLDCEERSGGKTILAAATRNEDLALLQTLLSAGASVNANGPGYVCTALEKAVECRNVEIVEYLLNVGANVSGISNRENRSVLCYAIVTQGVLMGKALLDAGADPNSTEGVEFDVEPSDLERDFSDFEKPDMTQSAIQRCATLGEIDPIALLIRAGANVNQQAVIHNTTGESKYGKRIKGLQPLSALEAAAQIGHLDMLQLLLDAGAKTHDEGAQQYRRALKCAASRCHFAAIRLLKEYHSSHLD